MAIIRANISIPEGYMPGGVTPAVSGKDDNALLSCKLGRRWG